MRNKLLVLLILCFVADSAIAKVTLPDILSDNMVLQPKHRCETLGKSQSKQYGEDSAIVDEMTTTVKTDKKGNW